MSSATLPVFLMLFAFGYGGKDRPVFSEEIQEIIQHVHNQCVEKTGVAEGYGSGFYFISDPTSYYDNILDITNCENGIFKEDNKLKCYMFCLMEEASLTDEEDAIDYDMLVGLIPEQYYDRVTNMIFACKHLDTMDKDKCQRAFDVHRCSYEKDPNFYFLF